MVEKPHKGNNTPPNKPNSVSGAMESQLRSLHRAFLERNEKKGSEALNSDKFVEYVSQQAGGRDLLSKINSSNVKVFFDNVQQQGTSVKTIKEHTNYFRDSGISEEEQLDQAYNRIKKNLESFPGKWDNFVKQHRLGFTSSPRGIAISEGAKNRTDIRSVGDLHAAWNSFLAKENINNDNLNHLLDKLPTARNERVMIHAIFEKTRTKLDPSVRGSFDQVIGALDAYSDITTVDDLATIIDQRVTQHPEQVSVVNDVIVRNGDIYKAYQRLGGMGSVQGDFSTWDRDLKTLIDHNSSLAATSTYEGSREYTQESIKKAQGMMQVLSPTIASLRQQYPMDDTTLRAAWPDYKRVDHITDELTLKQKTIEAGGDEGLRAKEAYEKLHQEQQILRRKAWVESIRSQDAKLAGLLAQGPSLDFDFSRLNKEDQCYLGWACAREKIENRDEEANLYGLDRERYSAFVREMFDPNQQTITIPTDEGKTISISIKDKGFLTGGVHPSQFQFKKLEDYKHLGFGVDVEVTDDNAAALTKMMPGLFQEIAGQKISPSYRVHLTDKNTGAVEEGYLMNVGYTGDEVRDSKGNTNNQPMQDQWMLFDYPPTKAGRKYPDPAIIRNGRNLGSTIDVEKDYDIAPVGKTLTLTGDSLDQLALGRALGDRINHPQHSKQTLDSSRGDMMDATATPDPDTYKDSYAREQQQINKDIDATEQIQESFLEGFNAMVKKPDSISKINSLDELVGKNLWIHHGKSQLPPKDGSVPYWVKLEITDVSTVDNTISFVMHGTDNDIKDNEGKKYTLPLENKTLRNLEESADDKAIHLLPDFGGDEMIDYIKYMQQADVLDKGSAGLFGGLELTKNGFKRNSDSKEITYFAEKKTDVDPNDPSKTIDIPFSYRVKRTGPDSFEVSNPDISYNRTMDMPTLIAFLGNRKLQAMTEKEKKDFDDMTINSANYKRKQDKGGPTERQTYIGGWFSLVNVRNFGKEMIQKANDDIDNYNKKKMEDMSEVLLGQYGLYGKVGGMLSWRPAAADAFDNMAGDYIQERDKKTFDLINGVKEFLAQNPDGEEVVGMMVAPTLTGSVPTKRRDILSAAGKYLYMLEEHGDPYGAGLREHRGSGLWVKILCGEWHYNNYLKEAERVRLALEADPTNINLLEEYADMEAKYIHQTIADNASFKKFFSKKYSDSVIVAKWKGNEPERINKTASIFGSQKDFSLNEILFGIKLNNGDIGKTIGHLKAMAMTAQSSDQINKVRLYLLELMLSGIILYQTNDVTKSTIISIASKIGFIPGMWVKDANQQHKIHSLLDYVSGGNFSQATGYSDSTFQRLSYGKNLGGFHKKYKGWINQDGKKVCEFLTLQDINTDPKHNLLAVLGEGVGAMGPGDAKIPATDEHISMLHDIRNGMMDNNTITADRELQNKFLFNAPLAIPNSVISSQLGPDRQGNLNTGNEKEAAMKEVFRKSMATSIPSRRMEGSEKFFIEKFNALLPSVTGHQFMRQALPSAQIHLKRGQTNLARMILTDTMRVLPVSVGMNSLDSSIESVLKKYVDFFIANLGDMKEDALLRALNMGGSLEFGDSNLAKPFDPTLDSNLSANKTPNDTLNKSIASLRKRLENSGYPWDYFMVGGAKTSNKKESLDDVVKRTRPDLPPLQNPEPYKSVIPTSMSDDVFNAMTRGDGRDMSEAQVKAMEEALNKWKYEKQKEADEHEDTYTPDIEYI